MKADIATARLDAALSTQLRPVRLLLCDDQRLIRVCVRQLFQAAASIRIVGEAATGTEAIRMALDLKPDLVLMDVFMPELDGIEATRQITAAYPGVRILAFSADSQAETMRRMLAAGAHGFLIKANDPLELVTAVQKVLEGERYVSRSLGGSTCGGRPD